jgi:hypothetical protein
MRGADGPDADDARTQVEAVTRQLAGAGVGSCSLADGVATVIRERDDLRVAVKIAESRAEVWRVAAGLRAR